MVSYSSCRLILSDLRDPLFLVCALIAAAVETLEKSGISNPWIHWYLSDLVCMPVFLFLSQIMERLITGNYKLNYDGPKIIAAWIIISILYEGIFPYFSPEYTADILDVVAYGVGAVGFYFYCSHRDNPAETRIS